MKGSVTVRSHGTGETVWFRYSAGVALFFDSATGSAAEAFPFYVAEGIADFEEAASIAARLAATANYKEAVT